MVCLIHLVRDEQPHYLGVVLAAAVYLVAFQVEIVDPILHGTYQRAVFGRPIGLMVLGQLDDFGADALYECLVGSLVHQAAGVAQHVEEDGVVAAEAQGGYAGAGAYLIGVEVGLGLAGDAQPMGQLVGIGGGIVGRQQVADHGELAEKKTQSTRDAHHRN